MTTYIALLRAVNVGGRGRIAMSGLRTLLTDLGFVGVRSLLQSGNLLFRGDDQPPAALEEKLEREAKERLDLETAFFVRTSEEWDEMVAADPFPDQARDDPSHLLVVFLKQAASAEAAAQLQAAIVGREAVKVRGRHAYIIYPDGIGRSKLTVTIIEKTLGSRGTGRNWTTVLKLKAAAHAVPEPPAASK